MRGRILKVTLAIVIIAVGSLVVYRVFFLVFVRVPTGSMANTIIPGDHLVVKKTVGTVERGNVIVFKWPKDPSIIYVSRVVGLPGETIAFRERKIFVNGQELSEQRVIVKPDDLNTGALQELSSEGVGPYRVFYFSDGTPPRPGRPFWTRAVSDPRESIFCDG